MRQSPIFTRTYDLLRWLIPVTVKFPRQHRFVMAETLQRTALAFQDLVVEASFTQQPMERLKQADMNLHKLRIYLRLSHDLKLLSAGQYRHVVKMIDEIGRLLGGWMRAQGQK
jgi:hypothetical protein